MLEIITQFTAVFKNLLREEWFWAIVTVVITLVSFIVQMRQENEISRASFVYNISNDFGNNERILRVYQWLEKTRRANSTTASIQSLQIAAECEPSGRDNNDSSIDFVDIDTYINHFEVVYVILRSVNIESIHELFQQRFLSFMFNPYVQKEVLFLCFTSNENNFLLLKKWLSSIYRHNKFSCESFVEYLNFHTCGSYELTSDALMNTRAHWPVLSHFKAKNYLMNYVHYICDPACLYGYYEFFRSGGTESAALRIIRPSVHDGRAILDLQKRIVGSMDHPEWYSSSTDEEIHDALNDLQNYLCLQICDGNRIVAFGHVIMNPTPSQDMNQDLKANGFPYVEKDQCTLETVFVDPEYRGFGIQKVLIRVLCSWAATLGKRYIAASVHPDNSFSETNFLKNDFVLVTTNPISKYGSVRNIFTKKLSSRDTRRSPDGTYTVYPYV